MKLSSLVSGNTYLLESSISSGLRCVGKCGRNLKCHVVSFNTDQLCKLYSIKAYHQLVYSNNSTVYIKQTYLSEYLNGLTNYWIGSSDGFDIISSADLYGGVNVQSAANKNGKAYSAFLFDSGYYRVPAGVYFYGNFTVSAWFKLSKFANYERLLDFGDPQSNNFLIALESSGKGCVSVHSRNYGSTSDIYSSNDLLLNIWYHLTVVMKGSTCYIYVNGILNNSGNINAPNNIIRNSNYIGRSNWYPSDFDVSASISNMKIINRALTNNEILLNMNHL